MIVPGLVRCLHVQLHGVWSVVSAGACGGGRTCGPGLLGEPNQAAAAGGSCGDLKVLVLERETGELEEGTARSGGGGWCAVEAGLHRGDRAVAVVQPAVCWTVRVSGLGCRSVL